jgi:trimeric autotransporter adhesin
MTSKKQVSPAIRILRGERDASARATHLEAATRKFLVTTNERKQMSTKTNFKRIALVAVASLGLGVLSSVPAKAAILSTVTVTTVDGIATKAQSDSVTSGASVSVDFLANATDSVVLSAVISSMPSGAATPALQLAFGDTAGSTSAVATPTGLNEGAQRGVAVSLTTTGGITVQAPSGGGRITTKLIALLDTTVARTTGTYVFTVVATPYSGLVGTPVSKNISIVVAALESESTVASSGTSTAYISTTAANSSATSDVAPSVLATTSSSNTPRAYIYVNLKNAAGGAVKESLTLTTTVGNIGTSSAAGKSVVVAYTGPGDYNIYSDGTAGTATITVKSTSVTFANKTVVFYAATPATITLTPLFTTVGVSTTNAFLATAKDANGAVWGGSLAVYSDTLGTISDTGTACSAALVATKGYHVCSVTGVVGGKAKVTVRNSTLAVVSSALELTVTNNPIASVKLSWDKAAYAPGEKAYLFVDTLDSAGNPTAGGNITNLFATGGITLSSAAGNGSDTLTSTTVFTTTSMANAAIGTATAPRAIYTVYMPAAGATVKASATGGTGVALAGQVAVSASATVTDSGAAALAAVTALATTVASLKTLITTLTNLVLKIQKKVKA